MQQKRQKKTWKKHDFRLFKESKVHTGKISVIETDTGYTNSLISKNVIKTNY
jgi:hypothetical protein